MSNKRTPDTETLVAAAQTYFAQATSYRELTQEQFGTHMGVSLWIISHRFPHHLWKQMCDTWAHERFLIALESVATQVRLRHELTAPRIAAAAGLDVNMVTKVFRKEWKARCAVLPTPQDILQATMQDMLDRDEPAEVFTYHEILDRAHLVPNARYDTWFHEARKAVVLEARRWLASSPSSVLYDRKKLQSSLFDLDHDVWDLSTGGTRNRLRKGALRADIAKLAWPFLQQELLENELSRGTIVGHFHGFVSAGTVLGSQVPDIRQATLEQVQYAWAQFEGTPRQRVQARWGLVQLFKHLQSEHGSGETQAFHALVDWLTLFMHLPPPQRGDHFLSEQEVTLLARACFNDILAGQAYVQQHSDLVIVNTRPTSPNLPVPLIHWSDALMSLLLLFTGLRRQSLGFIAIGDWIELRTGLYTLAWRHTKKGEEKVAILPAFLAELLTQYAEATSVLRHHIETPQLFLHLSRQGHWIPFPIQLVDGHLASLVLRHHLERDGVPLPLNCQILRRTYTTRALYAGQNIHAIRAQLGHMHLSTTLGYVRQDRYEHPIQVRHVLDAYGKKALSLWHQPLVLHQLESHERQSILLEGQQREQEVGWCRHRHCVMAEAGSPPPCSLCEHLVTGPEFLAAWETESQHRVAQLNYLARTPGAEMVLAQMKLQYEQFQANFVSIQQEVQ